jgi:peptidoglycan hydrolase-like protein with peptidoglycan-binding domain
MEGICGRATEIVAEQFQQARGLVVDGIAGPQTLGALGLG